MSHPIRFLAPLLLAAAPALQAAPEVYQIDNSHTFAKFSYNHMGLSTAEGRFDRTSGTITLDPKARSGAADVTIDATSVSTGWPKFDEHLKSKDFFDVAQYPTITFKSTDFRFSGEQLAQVAGDLTIHGVTRPVTLEVTAFVCKEHPMKKVPVCGADARTTIKRSDFGVGAYAPAVSDETQLRISIEAVRK